VPLGFQSETLRWRGILESPEPSSQGGSAGSNPVGATRIRLWRIRWQKPPLSGGFCVLTGGAPVVFGPGALAAWSLGVNATCLVGAVVSR